MSFDIEEKDTSVKVIIRYKCRYISLNGYQEAFCGISLPIYNF